MTLLVTRPKELNADLQAKAIRQLQENPKRLRTDINAIKDWIKKQPHLCHLPITDDEELIVCFLRGSKFSLEMAKKRIDSFFTVRGMMPEIFQNTDPLQSPMKEILALGPYLLLPDVVNKDGTAILIVRVGIHDPEVHTWEDIHKCEIALIHLFWKESPHMEVLGVTTVVDFRGANIAHAAAMRPASFKKVMVMAKDCLPVRMKGVHATYLPKVFEVFMNAFKNLMPDKLSKRVVCYSQDLSNLYEKVPKDRLPPELGGTYHMDYRALTEYWQKKAVDYRSWSLEMEKLSSNESLRPGRPKTHADVLGMEGSFRKLEID